jgi:hypothetical protein
MNLETVETITITDDAMEYFKIDLLESLKNKSENIFFTHLIKNFGEYDFYKERDWPVEKVNCKDYRNLNLYCMILCLNKNDNKYMVTKDNILVDGYRSIKKLLEKCNSIEVEIKMKRNEYYAYISKINLRRTKNVRRTNNRKDS